MATTDTVPDIERLRKSLEWNATQLAAASKKLLDYLAADDVRMTRIQTALLEQQIGFYYDALKAYWAAV